MHRSNKCKATPHKAKHIVPVVQVDKGMSVPEFLAATAALVAPVDAYFDKVFVMTDNEQIRLSRLALLQQVASLSKGILDFAELPGF